MRYYPEGDPIPAKLPPTYKNSDSSEVPSGQKCSTCRYYSTSYCRLWKAPVREDWWCASWKEKE